MKSYLRELILNDSIKRFEDLVSSKLVYRNGVIRKQYTFKATGETWLDKRIICDKRKGLIKWLSKLYEKIYFRLFVW